MSRPHTNIALKVAVMDASLSNLTFATNKATDAIADFSFFAAVAMGEDTAVRAGEVADAALARAATPS